MLHIYKRKVPGNMSLVMQYVEETVTLRHYSFFSGFVAIVTLIINKYNIKIEVDMKLL